MKTFHLEVITPDRTVFNGEVSAVTVPATGGSLGILANHAPLLTPVEIGALKITDPDGGIQYLLVSDGFLEVANNKARILAEVSEKAEEIDEERAARAEQRARERLRSRAVADLDLARAEAALGRALTRQWILRELRRRGGSRV